MSESSDDDFIIHDSYANIKPLGSGSFGEALLVQSVKDGGYYALKRIFLSSDKQQLEEATKEVEIIKSLIHPNITRFTESFIYNHRGDRSLCIVMEYADAGTLFDRIAEAKHNSAPFSVDQVMLWFVQTGLALLYLHQLRILHRDLKPHNIFLSGPGGCSVKLGDFGVSKELCGTASATVCGTPVYMAPEVMLQKPYNNKADVWSLGVVLYELLTLNRPFDGPGLLALRDAVCKQPHPPLPGSVPEPYQQLVEALLTKGHVLRPNMQTVMATDVVQQHMKALASRRRDRLEQARREREAEMAEVGMRELQHRQSQLAIEERDCSETQKVLQTLLLASTESPHNATRKATINDVFYDDEDESGLNSTLPGALDSTIPCDGPKMTPTAEEQRHIALNELRSELGEEIYARVMQLAQDASPDIEAIETVLGKHRVHLAGKVIALAEQMEG